MKSSRETKLSNFKEVFMMRKTWIFGILMILVLAGTAFARYGSPMNLQANNTTFKRPLDYLLEKGVTFEEYYQWRQSGKTMSEFLQSKKINEADLKAQILKDRTAVLDELVKAGEISKEERDARLVIWKENIGENWNSTEFNGQGCGQGRQRNGSGRMGGGMGRGRGNRF